MRTPPPPPPSGLPPPGYPHRTYSFIPSFLPSNIGVFSFQNQECKSSMMLSPSHDQSFNTNSHQMTTSTQGPPKSVPSDHGRRSGCLSTSHFCIHAGKFFCCCLFVFAPSLPTWKIMTIWHRCARLWRNLARALLMTGRMEMIIEGIFFLDACCLDRRREIFLKSLPRSSNWFKVRSVNAAAQAAHPAERG